MVMKLFANTEIVRDMSRRQKGIDIDGHHFASITEGDRYLELDLLERAGEISDLGLQPSFGLLQPFKLRKRSIRGMEYTADFSYTKGGERYIEEVKGHSTEPYRMRRKLFLYIYGSEYIFIESKRKGRTFTFREY
jgi:hypothetical protein